MHYMCGCQLIWRTCVCIRAWNIWCLSINVITSDSALLPGSVLHPPVCSEASQTTRYTKSLQKWTVGKISFLVFYLGFVSFSFLIFILSVRYLFAGRVLYNHMWKYHITWNHFPSHLPFYSLFIYLLPYAQNKPFLSTMLASVHSGLAAVWGHILYAEWTSLLSG